ncbi:MAG: HD domain-containing protein, partial [Nitrospirota bacterium]
NFTLEQDTAECIRERAERISESSPERVRDELFLILSELNVEEHLHRIHSLGLLMSMFPELVPLRGFTPGMYNGHDVLTHSLKTVGYLDAVLNNLESISPEYAKTVFNHLEEPLENFISRKAALRFACLLHDIAKPETFSDREGRIRFHDHDNLGAIKASQVCQRLRLSRDSEKLITGVIKYHMRLFNLSTSGGPSKNALYRYCRDMGAALPESLLLAQADARATSEVMPKEKFSDTEKTMKTVLEYYYSKFLKVEMRPLITGQDLINLGLTPGPRFREILDDIKEQQAEGILQAKRNAIEYIKKRL